MLLDHDCGIVLPGGGDLKTEYRERQRTKGKAAGQRRSEQNMTERAKRAIQSSPEKFQKNQKGHLTGEKRADIL